MSKKNAQFKHQGDIPFYPFTGKVSGDLVKHDGSLVLALGEHTGHKHIITVPNVDDMVAHKLPDGGWILSLKSEATVTHNQHGQIKVAPGMYRVGHEREVDHFQGIARKVID